MSILQYANEIRSAVLLILKGNNKEFMIIPNAIHTNLCDKLDVIPFDKMENFFKENLK